MEKRNVNGTVLEEIPAATSKMNEQLEGEAASTPPKVADAVAAGPESKYTLKGVKTFRGMDGIGLNAKLFRDGKEVAFILDEGCGGMVDFKWNDRMHGKSVEEDLFQVFIKAEKAKIPSDKVDELGSKVREVFDAEYWVNALVDDMESAKRMKRICKTKTLFQVDTEIGGPEFRTIKGVGPKIRAWIASKYAGKKIRILNDEHGA